MHRCLLPCLVVAVALLAACGRPVASDWTADDSQRAASVLADSLMESRWHSSIAAKEEPVILLSTLGEQLPDEEVDPGLFTAELRRRLVSAGLVVTTDAASADYVLDSTLRQAEDDRGDRLYLVEASLVAGGGRVAWADTVQVRKGRARSPAPARPGGGKSMVHDRRQPGDQLGSFPENKATQGTVNLHVTKPDLSEGELLADLATLRRVDGVRSIQETVDERGTARLLLYVLPHRELEVRQRLVDLGWSPIRF